MSANSESDALLVAASACTDELRYLLLGEACAVQTYRRAMEMGGFDAGALAPVLREHRDAANDIRHRLRTLGADATVTAAVWEEFAAVTDGTPNRIGSSAALVSLRRSEERGLERFEQSLDESKLDAPSKDLVRSRLLPRQRLHVAALGALAPAR